ncbi:MAG: hypothetical protein KIS30_01080 [Thermoplasmata archaeon]|nr:hypothetical protein [Candidatus Sysuiplasma acidicola]MBX8645342.1 hypothetical protein [Candidatus Sysuiplasma acidicola]
MTSSREFLEKMEKVIADLRELNSETPIIVEGQNDRKALRSLGIGGEIIVLNGRHTIFEMCEELGRRYRRAIILTDWDRKGGQLCRALSHGLASNGVRPDDRVRARISSLSIGESKDVEGLPSYVERLKKRALK